MLMVQKYGGTSLADETRLRAAARRLTELAGQGNKMVAVVSAQGDMTDVLIEKAALVNKHRAAREMDAYLAAGEQMSAGLLAMAIGDILLSASPDGRQGSKPTESTAMPGSGISILLGSAGSWRQERS